MKSQHKYNEFVANLGDHQTRVQLFGPENGIPVLFLHSLGLNYRSFNKIHARLQKGILAISFDQRGHGASDTVAPSEIYLESMAEDALKLLNYLELDSAHIVGHSLGGAVAALAYQQDPSKWRSVSIICSPPIGGDAFLNRAREALINGTDAIVQPTLQRWFDRDTISCNSSAVTYATQCLESMKIPQWVALWESLADFSGYQGKSWGDSHYLVIADDSDRSTPPISMKAIAENLPGAIFALSKRGGHMAPLTAPNQIARILNKFWR